ncbi:sterol desaturase family protein [Idiomarina sp.]|uniref:sterol desaturase family protein n=1 Tax=Idiomarina sp. TaxID=1874361 RepID=UPI0025BCF82A|nr:sterol desaturase family protein [Idiomarina sp.]NQZ04590.1 sterol desaturase family protein [Idiomarina sp.]
MEAWIRLSVFVAVLALMLVWEAKRPKRSGRVNRWHRWRSHLGLIVTSSVLMRLVVPLGLTGIALWASEHGWGGFNQFELPLWLAVMVSMIALDLVLYWQHRLFHRVPWLWRLHRVHHADPDFDVTTGVRFHPIEMILSLAIKAATILMLGAPAAAVIIFEIILNACSLFNHGNVQLPAKLETGVRKVLITQELHRIHHSSVKRETNSNYGFSVVWWDWLFGSYTDQPHAGSDNVDIGLREFREEQRNTPFWTLLALPFKDK